MSIHPLKGTASEERNRRFFCDFYEQWSAFLHPGRMNWIDFTFVKVQGEFAKYTGRVEFKLWLLGLGVCLTYVFDSSFNDEMERRMDEVIEDLKRPSEGKTTVTGEPK